MEVKCDSINWKVRKLQSACVKTDQRNSLSLYTGPVSIAHGELTKCVLCRG